MKDELKRLVVRGWRDRTTGDDSGLTCRRDLLEAGVVALMVLVPVESHELRRLLLAAVAAISPVDIVDVAINSEVFEIVVSAAQLVFAVARPRNASSSRGWDSASPYRGMSRLARR